MLTGIGAEASHKPVLSRQTEQQFQEMVTAYTKLARLNRHEGHLRVARKFQMVANDFATEAPGGRGFSDQP